MMLQINTAGAWRNVCGFPPEKYAEVVDVARRLVNVLGTYNGKPSASFCVLHPDGKRDWLRLEPSPSIRDQWKVGYASTGL